MSPLIGTDHAGQHLHQRRFAGAVLADHGVDGAGSTSRFMSSNATTPP